MNKFVQVVVAACAAVWLVIGLFILTVATVMIILVIRLNPLAKIQQASGVFQMLNQIGGGTTRGVKTSGGIVPVSTMDLSQLKAKVSSPEFISCATNVLGTSRVAELQAKNQMPETSEMLRLAPCLK